jgi:uncharacterized protein YgbK (DUF1537 family)
LKRLINNADSVSASKWSYIFLEGGATASAFIKQKAWSSFEVLPTNLLGVGCLRPKGISQPPILFVKPGSYPWPEGIWRYLVR